MIDDSQANRKDLVTAQFSTASAAASYAGYYQGNRFLQSRLHIIFESLDRIHGGDLLDVGCGPGMMVSRLADSRPGRFRIVAMDSSAAMARECSTRTHRLDHVRTVTGSIERIPLADASLDVVLAMGVLEYVDLEKALKEIGRVLRPEGHLLATMLNPSSPYRFIERRVNRPLLRLLGRVGKTLRVPEKRRPDVRDDGIYLYSERKFRQALVSAGFEPLDIVYYDIRMTVPPLDRVSERLTKRLIKGGSLARLDRSVSRGWRRRFGTAYMFLATPRPSGER